MRFKVASRVRGLSDEAFREAFGTEEQCRAALLRLRWPDGFVCPCCGHRGHCVLAGRGLYQCNRCKKQTSPTAGTIFHATKLPLTLWFAAIHLIVTAKLVGGTRPPSRGQAADGLGREAQDHGGDGAARGGRRLRGGSRWTTPISAGCAPAASGAAARRARRPRGGGLDQSRRPRKLKLVPVKGFRKREIARGAKHWLAPGAMASLLRT